jgi:hypothetical protein
MSEELYTVSSGDDVSFEVNRSVINQSKALREYFDETKGVYRVRLEFMHSSDLKDMIEYMKFHSDAEKEENHISVEQIKRFDETLVASLLTDNKSHLRYLVNSEKLGIIGLYKLVVHIFADKLKDKG